MKNPLQTLVIAGVIAITTASAAFAGGNHQQMAQRNWEYWNGKKAESKANVERQVSETPAAPKASQYPCPRCVYDQQAGGYVQKHYGKN